METSSTATATAGAATDDTIANSSKPPGPGCSDADMEDLFGGDDDNDNDNDMESLFGSLDDDNGDDDHDTGENSLASPASEAAPLPSLPPPPPPPLALPLPMPPLPLPALPSSSSSAVAAPADRNHRFCDVSTTTTLPESESGRRVEEEGEEQIRPTTTTTDLGQQQQHDNNNTTPSLLLGPDADPSGFDMSAVDLGDIEFDFDIDMSLFACGSGGGGGGGDLATAGAAPRAEDAGIDFDFGLGVDGLGSLGLELGSGMGMAMAMATGLGELAAAQDTGPLDTSIDTCFSTTPDTAADDVVVLYERPASPRPVAVSTSASASASASASGSTSTSTQPCQQLLSPASEPFSQASSRHASEEAWPAPAPASAPAPAPAPAPVAKSPVVPASLQASIPHYLELRPRCPQIPPPKRIDLGTFNVEELLPYVQLHSKLSMGGIQQMLGLDVDAGRLVVGECRRYLADPAHRVAPSGTSDPTALRMLKVALIQSALVLLQYGESGVHRPQRKENGVGERWFSRSSTLEPKSMHVWPDDSTTLVLLFIQLLYRLTRNNSVRERQRKASALRRAMNSPPRSPSPSDGAAGSGSATGSSRARPQKSAPRSSRDAPAAKRPRLTPSIQLPAPTTTGPPPHAAVKPLLQQQSSSHPLQPLQPILAYNSPRVLRDDLIMYASRKPPPTASIRYIVNVVDRSAQRMIPPVVLGHDGPIRSAGYSHLVQRCACVLGEQQQQQQQQQNAVTISIMTLLGLEKVSSDADWDRVVCRVYGDVVLDREVRVLISVGEK